MLFRSMVVADSPKTKEAFSESKSGSWVDVRDTALAHVLALEKMQLEAKGLSLRVVRVMSI